MPLPPPPSPSPPPPPLFYILCTSSACTSSTLHMGWVSKNSQSEKTFFSHPRHFHKSHQGFILGERGRTLELYDSPLIEHASAVALGLQIYIHTYVQAIREQYKNERNKNSEHEETNSETT